MIDEVVMALLMSSFKLSIHYENVVGRHVDSVLERSRTRETGEKERVIFSRLLSSRSAPAGQL